VLRLKSGFKEDLTMSDGASTPARADDSVLAEQPDGPDDAREAALIREVLRVQERHREGGIEPDLQDPEPDLQDPDPEA
jgi:hypothetical protein